MMFIFVFSLLISIRLMLAILLCFVIVKLFSLYICSGNAVVSLKIEWTVARQLLHVQSDQSLLNLQMCLSLLYEERS